METRGRAWCLRQVGGRMKRESNKRDLFIEGAIMGLGRNSLPGKLPGTHK